MKAVCKTCGKKFDPDKTDFLCPKCGAWYITGNHYDIGNENNQGTIYDCDDCDHENKMAYKEPKCHDTFDGSDGEMNRASKKVIGLAGIIIIIVSIGIGAAYIFKAAIRHSYYEYYDDGYYGDENHDDGYYDSDDEDIVSDDGMEDDGFGSNDYVDSDYIDSDYYDSVNVYDKGSDLNVMDYSYGEAIAGLNGDMGILLTVDEPVIVDSGNLDIPEGCILYRVHYSYIYPSGYNTDSDYGYGDSVGVPELYMYTKSGTFLKPLDAVERLELFSYDQDKYVEIGDSRSGIYAGDGNLFFITTNVDYDYLVVYDMVDETETENQTEEMICLVGSPLQEMEWPGIPENASNTSGFMFDLYSLPYIEKIEPGTVVDLPVYKDFDLTEYAADNNLPDVDEYDCYVVGMNWVNYTDRTLSFPYITGINFDSGDGVSVSQIKYYENEDQYIPPASVAARYYLVFMPKDAEPTLTVIFYNSKADDLSISLMNEHTFTLK